MSIPFRPGCENPFHRDADAPGLPIAVTRVNGVTLTENVCPSCWIRYAVENGLEEILVEQLRLMGFTVTRPSEN